jgi:hypothetical protein
MWRIKKVAKNGCSPSWEDFMKGFVRFATFASTALDAFSEQLDARAVKLAKKPLLPAAPAWPVTTLETYPS